MHGWSGLLIVWALALAGVVTFSLGVFAITAKSEQEIRRRNRELEATAATATVLGQSLKLEELLNVALEKVLEIVGVQAGTVCVLDEVAQELVHMAHRGIPPEVLGPLNRAKLADAAVGREIVKTGKPVVLNNLWEDPRVAETVRRVGFRSAVNVPLRAEGRVVGILALVSKEERCFSPSEVAVLTSVGSQLGMAVRKAVLFGDLVRRNLELVTVNSISSAVSSSLDLTEVMVTAVDRVIALVGAEAGEVWLLEETGRALHLAVHRGLFPDSFHEIHRLPVGEGFPGLVAQTGELVITHDLANDGRYVRQSVKDEGFQFMACLPLRSRGRVVGTIGIASRQRLELSLQDLQLLESVGGQIGVAIENAALHRKVHHMAVLEERERIAREMHDGLGQILGYVNTKTQAVRRMLAAGQGAEAEQALGQMEEASREVYADVREAIVGLRTSTSSGGGLVPAVREYVEWFTRQNAIQTELTLGDLGEGALDTKVEIQLIRIVQEALSNVRKHAKAQRAWVHLAADVGNLCLTVQDDGHGFHPEHIERGTWPQFGLQTMRERAESVGGTFEVHSAPLHGTRVSVRVPRGACLR